MGKAQLEPEEVSVLRATFDELDIDQSGTIDADEISQALARLGMPQGIVMRHRPTHFQHLFAYSGYAAAYCVYLWAEVLDAYAFDAFMEACDCFDAAGAARCKRFIYSAGNSQDPSELFRQFRGRDAIVEPMLRKKGLV